MTADGKPRRRFWGWCRCSFRWFRISCLALVLLVVAALTWLRFAGLPEFVHRRVVSELAQRGVITEFSSLHFHWFRGLVARDLRIAWGGTNGPRLAIVEADLDIAPPPWRESRDFLRGLSVRQGLFMLPLPVPDEPLQRLVIENISADIRFLPGDAWEIRRLGAQTLGLNLDLQATLTNVAGLRRPAAPSDPAAVAQRLRIARALVEELGRWHAPQPPHLQVNLHLDGNQLEGSDGYFYLEVPEVRTPHGNLQRLRVSALIPASPASDSTSPSPANLANSSVTLEFAELQTPRGSISDVTGRLDFQGPPRPAFPTNATWQLKAEQMSVRGFRGRSLSLRGTNELLAPLTGVTRDDLFKLPVRTRAVARARRIEAAEIQHAPVVAASATVSLDAQHTLSTNFPTLVLATADVADVRAAPGTLGALGIRTEIRPAANVPVAPDGLDWWSALWPFEGTAEVAVTNLQSPDKLAVERLDLEVDWKAPAAAIRRLNATLYGGILAATGRVDAVTREGVLSATTTFDLHGIDALLGDRSRSNFVRYRWSDLPRFEGSVRAVLPPWTDPQPDWDAVVKPTIRLDARFDVGHGSFKNVPFDSARSSLSFDGANWRLPDLHTTSPEGSQVIAVDYSEDTREYRIDARGSIDPRVLRPLLGDQSAEVLELFEFKSPVDATVTVWGPWTEGDRQSIVGQVAATDFVFRGQAFDRLEAQVVYTNHFLAAAPVKLARGGATLAADGVGYDFEEGRLWLTNVQNNIEPAVVAAAINPDLPEKLKHYRFDHPPQVKVEGSIRPAETGTAGLTFDVDGGPFHFWRFSSDRISTRLLWEGTTLTLTNIDARFYQGTLRGDAAFELSNPDDGAYRFSAHVGDARLEELLRELTPGKTNVAQGLFDLDLDITSARTSDLRTWNGHGKANLRDGLLWDAPIFGFLSPVLNAIVPGLGNNRAKRADASFVVTNGVFTTRDLSISCPPAKLLYRGTIDLDQRVNAKVEGQVLSDIGGIGPLFGLVLRPLTKLLEFRVTGTLSKVDAEPLYIPKVLFLPLQPIRALMGIFGSGGDAAKERANTNAPPAPIE